MFLIELDNFLNCSNWKFWTICWTQTWGDISVRSTGCFGFAEATLWGTGSFLHFQLVRQSIFPHSDFTLVNDSPWANLLFREVFWNVCLQRVLENIPLYAQYWVEYLARFSQKTIPGHSWITLISLFNFASNYLTLELFIAPSCLSVFWSYGSLLNVILSLTMPG